MKMKNKVAVAMLLSTSLVSLNSAASDAIALSSQYQAASEVNREDVKIEKLKNKIITSFNDVELLGTLKKIEDSLYEVTEDLSNDFIKNYNFSAILIDVVDLESALLKFIDEKLITKVQVKDPLRLIFSIKNGKKNFCSLFYDRSFYYKYKNTKN